MSTPDGTRSVRIGNDERLGWSSDRPRRDGTPQPPRGPQVAVRCRVLAPSDRQRYSPGSLVVITGGGSPDELERFAERRVEDKGAILSLAKVRTLLAGRVGADEIEAAAAKILDGAVAKRLGADQAVVVLVETLDPEQRARFVVPAAAARKPRHLIFLDIAKDKVADEDRDAVNEFRRTLDAGGLGEEGFVTALRLGGTTINELNRIVFRPPPAED